MNRDTFLCQNNLQPFSLNLYRRDIEKTSVIITSNKPFEEWGDIFADDVVTAAIPF